MAETKNTPSKAVAKAAVGAADAKSTKKKRRKSKMGKSSKPNFNTYIYRVLKEVSLSFSFVLVMLEEQSIDAYDGQA